MSPLRRRDELADAPGPSRGRFCGLSVIRFPRVVGTSPFALRLLRLRDLPELHLALGAEIRRRPAGRGARRLASLMSFWRWLCRSFDLVYLVECSEAGSPRTVGFVGLYGLVPGRSVSLSAAIFDSADRRRGYGKQSLEILCSHLSERAVVGTVFAEVLKGNGEPLGLLHALGFEVCGEEGERFLLRKRL